MPLNIILLPLTLYLDYSQAVMPLNMILLPLTLYLDYSQAGMSLNIILLPLTLLRLLTGCHATKHYLTTISTLLR